MPIYSSSMFNNVKGNFIILFCGGILKNSCSFHPIPISCMNFPKTQYARLSPFPVHYVYGWMRDRYEEGLYAGHWPQMWVSTSWRVTTDMVVNPLKIFFRSFRSNLAISNFNVHTDHLGILLKCRFWILGWGWGLRFCISKKLMTFCDADTADPQGTFWVPRIWSYDVKTVATSYTWLFKLIKIK